MDYLNYQLQIIHISSLKMSKKISGRNTYLEYNTPIQKIQELCRNNTERELRVVIWAEYVRKK